ncbi:MAG: Do family serine endopeptidase [Bryobacteraceae bacterium]
MSMLDTMRKQKFLSFSLLLFTLSIGILIGTLLRSGASAQRDQAASDATPLTIPNPVQLSTAFSQLAKKLEPSVVNIATDYVPQQERASKNRRQQAPESEDDQGFDMFRRFFGPFGEMPGQQRRSGTGSGVIVDPKGYILTNNHVVDGATRIKVKLTGDPVEYEAKLIGTDPETDLAVVRIDAPRSLTAAKIGNSDAVQVGDWAVAIGSPFGLEATVTAGIISAKERDLPDAQQFQHFLQTDAAINPGNSGGPLLNINGEVIGINTAIATSTSGYQGVGFALPMNTAVKVYNQIIKTGRVTRGSIGASLPRTSDPSLLKAYGVTSGAFISAVSPGGPAEKGGLKEADVVVSVNGKPIKSNDEFINTIAETPVGTQATLGIVRDGKKMDLKVTIGDRAEIWADNPRVTGRRSPQSGEAESAGMRFGISVRNLSSAEKADTGLEGKNGVLITDVDATSFAEDIGLRPDDVITEINRQPVTSVDDIRRIQSNLKPGDVVAFRVLREAGTARRGARSSWTALYLAGTLPNKF